MPVLVYIVDTRNDAKVPRKVQLSIPTASVRGLYEMLNENHGVSRAPELLRRARVEIIEYRLIIPVDPWAYVAYAYLMMKHPEVPAEERADHIRGYFMDKKELQFGDIND